MSLCQLLIILFPKNAHDLLLIKSNIFISRNTEKEFTFYRIIR